MVFKLKDDVTIEVLVKYVNSAMAQKAIEQKYFSAYRVHDKNPGFAQFIYPNEIIGSCFPIFLFDILNPN